MHSALCRSAWPESCDDPETSAEDTKNPEPLTLDKGRHKMSIKSRKVSLIQQQPKQGKLNQISGELKRVKKSSMVSIISFANRTKPTFLWRKHFLNVIGV
jgi:hypothetical protein